MAAVIDLHTGQALADGSGLPPRSGAPSGPRLRVIEGGRSAVSRQLRLVYLVRRSVVLLALVLVVLALVQMVGTGFGSLGETSAPPVAVVSGTHLVQPGDTLWAIAEGIAPQADPRDVVDRIAELNRGGPALSAAGNLISGESLRLPVGS